MTGFTITKEAHLKVSMRGFHEQGSWTRYKGESRLTTTTHCSLGSRHHAFPTTTNCVLWLWANPHVHWVFCHGNKKKANKDANGSQAWWPRQTDYWVWQQTGPQNRFQTRQGYLVIPYLKYKNEQNIGQLSPESHQHIKNTRAQRLVHKSTTAKISTKPTQIKMRSKATLQWGRKGTLQTPRRRESQGWCSLGEIQEADGTAANSVHTGS